MPLRHGFSRRALIVAALGFSFLLMDRSVQAHAIVVESSPKPNAKVSVNGFDVRIKYNSRIDHKRSKLLLIDSAGKEVEIPHNSDAAPDEMLARIEKTIPGRYKMRWQVLAVDGHITRGDIPVTVTP